MAIQRTPEEYKAAYVHHKSQGNLDKAKRVANLYRETLKPQATDNAFEYSTDQAQRMGGKGLEAIGRATGIKGVEDFGTGVVEQQDKDIAQGGYTPKYNKSLRDTFNEDGLESAVGWLGEKTAENSVSGGVALGGGLATAAVATVSAPAAAVVGLGTIAASGTMGAGEAAFEQEEKVGDYDAALASGQGVLIGILDRFGASKVIPASKLLKMTPKEIVDTLNKKGFANAAKQVAKKTGIEGVTEVAQEGVSMAGAASRGGEYTQKEVEDRSIDAFALGSTNAGAVQTITGGASLVRGKPANLSDRASQATFAQRLDALAREGNAEGKEFDLSDLDTTSGKGVRALMDLAHAKIASEITNLESELSSFLNINDKTLTSAQKSDRTRVKKMLQQARNKTKSVVGKSDFDLLNQLVGGTADGKRLINVVKESQEQTKVWNAGMKGGVSKFTDNVNPLPQSSNYSGQAALTNAIRGVSAAGVAGATAGASIPYQVGAVVGGRLIDGITGRRSKVRRYIKNNLKNEGLGTVSGLGERDKNLAKAKAANEKAQAKTEEKRQNERAKRFFLYTEGAPPVDNSPEDIYQRFTGMDRAGLEATIAEALENPNLDPTVRDNLETLVESMKYGEKVSGFAVNYINLLANNNPEVANRRVRPIENPNGLNTAIAIGGASGRPITPKEQGKLDNNAIVNQLKKDLEADVSLNTREREQISKALDKMLYDLGKNPVDTMISIEKALIASQIPQVAVARYVSAYKDRVIQQQQRKKGGDTPPTDPEPTPSPIVGVDGQPIRPQPPIVQPEPQPPIVQPEPQPPIVQPEPPSFPEPINMPDGDGVKEQLPKAKIIARQFDIGNKGSIWEKGIATIEDFMDMAKALNLSLYIANTQDAFNQKARSMGYTTGPTTNGFFGTNRDGRGGVAQVRGSKRVYTPLGILMTTAHEVSHAVEHWNDQRQPKRRVPHNHPESKGLETTHKGSYRHHLNELVGSDDPRAKTIRDEINNLQDLTQVFFEKNPALGSDYIRFKNAGGRAQFEAKLIEYIKKIETSGLSNAEILRRTKIAKNRVKSHINYVKDPAEFAVDPIWVYMANPTLFKAIAPETAKDIQQFFKNYNKDFPISFHANPMVTILAIVLAGMAVTGKDEEEEQRPVQQSLPPGQGILTV